VTDHRIGLTLYNLPQSWREDRRADRGPPPGDYEEKLAALTGQTYAPARFTGED